MTRKKPPNNNKPRKTDAGATRSKITNDQTNNKPLPKKPDDIA